MRAIIRFSVDNGPWLRNNLAGHLKAVDFQRNGKTAAWEHKSITEAELYHVVAEIWRWVAEYQKTERPGRLDHLWMYADMPDDKTQVD